jgi:hypothetical protein
MKFFENIHFASEEKNKDQRAIDDRLSLPVEFSDWIGIFIVRFQTAQNNCWFIVVSLD